MARANPHYGVFGSLAAAKKKAREIARRRGRTVRVMKRRADGKLNKQPVATIKPNPLHVMVKRTYHVGVFGPFDTLAEAKKKAHKMARAGHVGIVRRLRADGTLDTTPIYTARPKGKRNPTAFEKCVTGVKKKGSAILPESVCATAGRKKFGKQKFQALAAAGKALAHRHNPAPPGYKRGTRRNGRSYVQKGVTPPLGWQPRAGDTVYIQGRTTKIRRVGESDGTPYVWFTREVDGMSAMSIRNLLQVARVPESIRPNPSLFDAIGPGDRVTILVPSGFGRQGQEYSKRTGRVVMRGPAGWVLNLGGAHGTPGIATPQNVVAVKKAKNPSYRKIKKEVRGAQGSGQLEPGPMFRKFRKMTGVSKTGKRHTGTRRNQRE